MDPQNDSIVLEEEIDPNYEPTEREVLEYATWLGMDLENEQDLFWIAREGLKAPLPENWKPCKTTDTEEIYYFNFATGQSTWDHPCDEFYRNLYEENKKKRTGGGKKPQDGDEKKKKEKEDVAELLGRKAGGGGKKKKASLSRAEPLGPPTLGRANPLEKKPLPGLSGKLGVLGAPGGGPTLGGLKAASGLGRLRGVAKEADESKDDGDDSSDEPSISLGGLSKPPLGGLLTRKPLSSPAPKHRDTKAEMNELAAEFEVTKQRILDEQAAAVQAMEAAHQEAIETLRQKLQKQLRDVEEDGESSAKQRKRELDKKLNNLENQFDRDENALLRERKEKLKRLDSDGDAALAHKRQDLEREITTETDRMTARHTVKMRELQETHDREEKALETKLTAALGAKARDASAANELKRESERLAGELASLSSDLAAVRSERDALKEAKSEAESGRRHAEQELASLRDNITAGTGGRVEDETEKVLAQELAELKTELDSVRTERSGANAKLQDAQRAVETLRAEGVSKSEQLVRTAAEFAALTKELEAVRCESNELAHSKVAVEATLSEVQLESPQAMAQARANAERKLEQAKRERETLEREVATLRERSQSVSSEPSGRAEELELALAMLKQEVDALRRESESAKKLKVDAESRLTRAQHEVETLRSELTARLKEDAGAAEDDGQRDVVEELTRELTSMKHDLESAKSKKDALVRDKCASEAKLKQAEDAVETLDTELATLRRSSTDALNAERETQLLATRELKTALEAIRSERDELQQALAAAETKSRLAATSVEQSESSRTDDVKQLRAEVAALQQQERALRDELAGLQQQNMVLADAKRTLEVQVVQASQASLAARAEASSARDELSDVQEQLQVLATTNTQVKEQLLKETNEKKRLRERLDAQESELRQVAAERTLLATQLNDLIASHQQHAQSSALESVAELTRQKFEIEQLQATLKAASDARTRLGERVKALENDVETQQQHAQRAALAESAKLRREIEQLEAAAKITSSDRARVDERVKALEAEVETQRQRVQKAALEALSDGSTLKRETEQLQIALQTANSDRARLDERVKLLESEIDAHQRHEQSSAFEAHAELTRQRYEMDQLQAMAKVVNDAKTRLEERVKVLESERESLTVANSQLTEKARANAFRTAELENELRTATVERDRTRQLKEIVESQREVEQAGVVEAQAELTRQKWELEQLQAAAKLANGEKARLEQRARLLETEVESLAMANNQLAEKARANAFRTAELENELRTAAVEQERASERKRSASKTPRRERSSHQDGHDGGGSSRKPQRKTTSGGATDYRKWSKRLEVEIEVLSKMQSLVMNQRRELRKQSVGDKLRSRHGRVRRSSNNHNAGVSGDNEDDGDDGVLSDGECNNDNQSEIDSLLDTLEKLNDELMSEADDHRPPGESGSFHHPHQRLRAFTPSMDRYRGWEYYPEGPESMRSGYCPPAYTMVPPDFSPMWRYPPSAASLSRMAMPGMAIDGFYAPPGVDMYAPTSVARETGFGRPFPQRMAKLSRRTRSASERTPERTDPFQRQISRWAKDRERVQHAATRHAHWLTGMCEELRRYGAQYSQDAEERRDAAAVASLEADDGT